MSKRIVTWDEVDEFIREATERMRVCKPIGIYGVPRGGLTLAVMLSHSLNIPLLASPYEGCIIVDDISDSGKTLKPYRGSHVLLTMFLRNGSETVPSYYKEILLDDTWCVFPWEKQN